MILRSICPWRVIRMATGGNRMARKYFIKILLRDGTNGI
jgi:hypothetical protein